MTGSSIQLYNGMLLIFTFFSCRLVYGTYQSVQVFRDIYGAIGFDTAALEEKGGLLAFANEKTAVPTWLAGSYLISNMILNSLNFYWFIKMIQAVTKRFTPAADQKGDSKGDEKTSSTSTAIEVSSEGLRKRQDAADVEPELEVSADL
jgi:hypothetical protein